MYTIKIANNVTTNVPELKDFLYKSVLLTNFNCFNMSNSVSNIISFTYASTPTRSISGYMDRNRNGTNYVYLYQRQKFRKNNRSERNVITIYKVPVNKVKYAKQFNHHFKLELI